MAAKKAQAKTAASQEPPRSKFDLVSKRVVDAIAELNGALQEAHDCGEVRVYLRPSPEMPSRIEYEIYRLAMATFSLQIIPSDAKSAAWQHVSGHGLKGIRVSERTTGKAGES